MDSVKYLYGTPSLVGKLTRWLIMLFEFDIEYVTKKTIEGQALTNFLMAHLVEDDEQWEIDFPDEHLNLIEKKGWKLYFDESAYTKEAGLGVLLESPQGEVISMLKRLRFVVTNNMNFTKVIFTNISRVNTRIPNDLANLTSTWEEISTMPKKPFMMSSGSIPCYEGERIMDMEKNYQPWFHDILQWMTKGVYPELVTRDDKRAL
ncbi:uncharacterized protein LOC119370953 [Jatropha curcas]|uniref:uncharacterized protein LOC119370953 n=1 Tax=Jatropha curcas TaxID=180498 RepID=UPI0005FAE0D9|nr:uncharacterized protein LOC119370953 [Jatropha curcas]